MTDIIGIGSTRPEEVASRIRQGQLLIYPTDTVYGLGCDATNCESVGRIFQIKKRPLDKPLSVAFSSVAELLKYVDVDENQRALLEKKLPGPYTFIVKNKAIPRFVTGGKGGVGVRVPDYGPLLNIFRKAGVPVITTSANISGQNPPRSVNEISHLIIREVDFVLDGGSTMRGKSSEVLDLTSGERVR